MAVRVRFWSRRSTRELAAISLLPIGVVIAYVGITIGMACTSYLPFTHECTRPSLALPGLVAAFLGGCLALFGLVSALTYDGKEAPILLPPVHHPAPAIGARAEHLSRLLFVALIGAGLAAAEAFPVYDLAEMTMEARPPTFDPATFAADLVLFAIADLIVLFLAYTWAGTD